MRTTKKFYVSSPSKATCLYWFPVSPTLIIRKYPIFPLQSFFLLANLAGDLNRSQVGGRAYSRLARSWRETEGGITMKATHTMIVALGLLLCIGCATPPEVKQALIAKDRAYAENERLMHQYRELVSNVTKRHHQWSRYVYTRLLLDQALLWATTNPKVTDVADADVVTADAEVLGSTVIAMVNEIRLKNLPERKGTNGMVVFQAGAGDMNGLLQKLPELIGRIEQRVAEKLQASPTVDLTAFDQYRTNVDALRRINAVIKQYMDIDVTLSRDDVQSIAEAVRTLRR